MEEFDTKQLTEELKQFRAEKEKIRKLVGQIGGKTSEKRERYLTIFFAVILLLLFIGDLCRHFMHVKMSLPPLLSLEVAVMLVSVKLIWMVHSQTKVEHFQFWILNSIEFRLNEMSKDI